MNGDEYVSAAIAGNVAGIPERTVRHWIAAGKVAAMAGHRGKLVRLGDVLEIARLTGRTTRQSTVPPDDIAGNDTAKDGKVTGSTAIAGNVADRAGPAAVQALVQQAVSAAVTPLVDEIARLSEVTRQQAEELGSVRERLRALDAAQDQPQHSMVASASPQAVNAVNEDTTADDVEALWAYLAAAARRRNGVDAL